MSSTLTSKGQVTIPKPIRDYLGGAHAAVSGWPVLTRDEARIRGYFPTVALLVPR